MTRTLAVDFDGVVHGYTRGWLDGTIYDPPLPGAIEGLRALMEQYAVFIHTSRDPKQVAAWLGDHGLPAVANDGLTGFWNEQGRLLVTSRKLPAVAYIDDRAVRFVDWPNVLAAVRDLPADGKVSWDQAPIPRRWHRCRPHTGGEHTALGFIERCACGARRFGGSGRWVLRNSRGRRGG